jgi:hypothetical protein
MLIGDPIPDPFDSLETPSLMTENLPVGAVRAYCLQTKYC